MPKEVKKILLVEFKSNRCWSLLFHVTLLFHNIYTTFHCTISYGINELLLFPFLCPLSATTHYFYQYFIFECIHCFFFVTIYCYNWCLSIFTTYKIKSYFHTACFMTSLEKRCVLYESSIIFAKLLKYIYHCFELIELQAVKKINLCKLSLDYFGWIVREKVSMNHCSHHH